MNENNYATTFLVDKSPMEVFEAVNNVRGWWTENVTGETEKQGDEFSVRFWDIHYSAQKIVEMEPGKKVVWLVTDSKLTFIKDQQEWTGMQIIFDITNEGDMTRLRFTQQGLNPTVECFGDCSNAWSGYINGSLKDLITSGQGKPEKKVIENEQLTK